jgi:tRNA threonylcarbamoyl adenosine modification protein YeaZ
MYALAVDTSLPLLSVALLSDRSVLGTIALEGKGSRNEKLLPSIDWLLTESGIERGAIDLFAVTRGPGSFTGVRIGLATIQGLALAIGRPVCAMSTHEAIALGEGTPPEHPIASLERILVWDDAGRGEIYLSFFEGRRQIVAPRLATVAERDELARTAALVIQTAEFIQHGNVAAGCARRAVEIQASGEAARYADATPIYVRLAEAEVKLQQKTNG